MLMISNQTIFYTVRMSRRKIVSRGCRFFFNVGDQIDVNLNLMKIEVFKQKSRWQIIYNPT